MDIDPLGDSAPPRYAVESDEEDEYNPISSTGSQRIAKVDIRMEGNHSEGKPLAVVTGDAARFWTRGADLGEHFGAIVVNQIQIGLLFSPSWTKKQTTILISETTTRLPTWAMYKYVEYVIDVMKPKSVSILDTYPVPVYITAEALPYHQAPIRYLHSGGKLSTLANLPTFCPPNLISSISACFLSLSTLWSTSSPAPLTSTVILLPSPYISPPPPQSFNAASAFRRGDEDPVGWSTDAILSAQGSLLDAVGDDGRPKWGFHFKSQGLVNHTKKADIGEGGMYI